MNLPIEVPVWYTLNAVIIRGDPFDCKNDGIHNDGYTGGIKSTQHKNSIKEVYPRTEENNFIKKKIFAQKLSAFHNTLCGCN